MRIPMVTMVVTLLLAPAALAAQGPPRLGGQLSFAQDENAGIGVRLEQPLSVARTNDLRLLATFDYFFPNAPFNYWELNTDLGWGFRVAGTSLEMYGGGGLNLARSGLGSAPGSGRTDVGLNVLLGVRIPTASQLRPYVELRPELGGGDRVVLTTGVLF